MSTSLRLFAAAMRRILKPGMSRLNNVRWARWGLTVVSLAFWLPFGVRASWQPGSPALWWLVPKACGSRQVVLYFHGGGYVAGSPWTHRGLMGRIALASGAKVVAPRYRLAPENRSPAAFDDACRAFEQIVASGIAPGLIILAGDSAGGGIAAALANSLASRGVKIAGLVLLSPWTDLTGSSDSLVTKAKVEALLPGPRLKDLIAEVRGTLPCDDPRLSPLFGTAPTGQPTLILVGEDEILLDDSRRLAAHLRSKGALVDLHVQPAAPHVYPYLAPFVPEARAAIRQIAAFLHAVSADKAPV
jgi:epsilon-lactone hydrolase